MVRFSITLVYVALVSLLYWMLYGQPAVGMDDANIYFTYAKNLVNGHGFVYYPGGEYVEGFTSFLWTLIIAAFYYVSPQHFPLLLSLFSVVLLSLSLTLCFNFIRKLTRATAFISPQEVLFLMLLTIIPGFVDWTVLSLMETGIWSLFIVTITLRVASSKIDSAKDRAVNALLLSFFVVLRPESLLWCFAFIGFIFIKYLHDSRKLGVSLVKALPMVAAVLVTMGGFTAFRLMYFGYPLPNTYYAKVSSDLSYNLYEGVRYLVFCCIQSPMLLLVVAAGAVSAIMLGARLFRLASSGFNERLKEHEWVQLILTAVTFVSLLIPVYVGGDHFKLLRFLQPFFPLYYLLFFNKPFWGSVANIQLRVQPAAYFVLVALVVPFIYMSSATPLHTYIKDTPPLDWEFKLAERGRLEAQMIDSMFSRLQEPPTVGVSAAGGFGYAYNGVVYDLMGLNNVRMAHASEIKTGIKNHAAFDKAVFFEMQPDIFHGYFKTSYFVDSPEDQALLENEPGFEKAYVSRMYKQLFREPGFVDAYKPVIIGDKAPYLKTYASATFIEELRANDYTVVELQRKNIEKTMQGIAIQALR